MQVSVVDRAGKTGWQTGQEADFKRCTVAPHRGAVEVTGSSRIARTGACAVDSGRPALRVAINWTKMLKNAVRPQESRLIGEPSADLTSIVDTTGL